MRRYGHFSWKSWKAFTPESRKKMKTCNKTDEIVHSYSERHFIILPKNFKSFPETSRDVTFYQESKNKDYLAWIFPN
jgi:hypothetical protein